MRTTRNPQGTRTTAEGGWRWQDAAGLAAPAVALALWVLLLAGIAAPLGEALGRIDGARPPTPTRAAAPEPCPLPAGALASAALPRDAVCR